MSKVKGYEHAYCIFCRSGSESRLAERIMQRFENVRAIVGMREKHLISNGQKEIDRRVLLPGYLFLFAKEVIDPKQFRQINDLYKVLATDTEILELKGSDREFARWLYINDGIIGISRLQFKDGKLKSIEGPMKYFAKKIIKIDKHTSSAKVRMDFQGRQTDIWLAFEFVDN